LRAPTSASLKNGAPLGLDASDFGFYDNSGKFVVEPGEIEVYAGDSSAATLEQSLTVTG
jgi:beta-glucosidase